MMDHQGSKGEVRRLGVFQLYDQEGIVDKYIFYLLASLSEVTERIIIVVNGIIKDRYKDMLYAHGYDVYQRYNTGGDFCAYKDVLENYVGWKNVNKYDELVLSNATYYGPFYPFLQVFADMDKKKLDFWGITKTDGDYEVQTGDIPPACQGYFMVVRARMLHSDKFRDFWHIDLFNDSTQHKDWVAIEHEWLRYFGSDFSWDVCVSKPVFDVKNVRGQFPVYFSTNGYMIVKNHCPVLKRRTFNYGYRTFQYTGHDDLRQGLEYIDKHTNYDIDMIWENVLRVYNIVDIKEAVPLSYVCSDDISRSQEEKWQQNDFVVVASMPIGASAESYFREYMAHISADIILLVQSENDKDNMEEICESNANRYYSIINMGNEAGLIGLLREEEIWCRYSYICFIDLYDNEMAGQSVVVGEKFRHDIWRNLAANDEYILQILELFKNKPRLGLLVPPEAYHGHFFREMSNTWCGCFSETKELADKIGVKNDISSAKHTFGYSGSFVCRTEALCLLRNEDVLGTWIYSGKKNTKIAVLRHLLIYAAQGAGYFSATVETDKQAAAANVDMRFMLQEMISCVQRNFEAPGFVELMLEWGEHQLLEFVHKYDHIYIYGAGDYGQATYNMLRKNNIKVDSFLVSDGQPRETKGLMIPIRYVSEVEFGERTGVVIAVIKQKQGELLREAENHGCLNVFKI